MSTLRHPRTGLLRHVFLTLACLAVALKVLVPAGFMAKPATNDSPYALVLCTGTGMVTVAPGEALPGHEHDKAPADQTQHSPCLFAGAALSAPPPSAAAPAVVAFAAYDAPDFAVAPELAPGRGRPAPPLPARGPPALLI